MKHWAGAFLSSPRPAKSSTAASATTPPNASGKPSTAPPSSPPSRATSPSPTNNLVRYYGAYSNRARGKRRKQAVAEAGQTNPEGRMLGHDGWGHRVFGNRTGQPCLHASREATVAGGKWKCASQSAFPRNSTTRSTQTLTSLWLHLEICDKIRLAKLPSIFLFTSP